MLKIKDNVDLKELEKFGFEGKRNKYDFNDTFRFTRPNEEYFIFVDNNTHEIISYKGKVYGQLELWAFAPFEEIELKEEYIKDLIQAGLVEKVEVTNNE